MKFERTQAITLINTYKILKVNPVKALCSRIIFIYLFLVQEGRLTQVSTKCEHGGLSPRSQASHRTTHVTRVTARWRIIFIFIFSFFHFFTIFFWLLNFAYTNN